MRSSGFSFIIWGLSRGLVAGVSLVAARRQNDVAFGERATLITPPSFRIGSCGQCLGLHGVVAICKERKKCKKSSKMLRDFKTTKLPPARMSQCPASPTRVCYKTVPTRVPHKSVTQECSTRVSHKSALQECPRRLCHKSVLQECATGVPTRVCYKSAYCNKSVPQESVVQESALQECPTRLLQVCAV